MKRIDTLLKLSLICLLSACSSAEQHELRDGRDELRVEGDVEETLTLRTDDYSRLLAQDVRLVPITLGDREIQFRAVPLAALVSLARPRISKGVKNHFMSFAIAASARDGYTTIFTYDEVVPHENGEPWVFIAFAEKDGPLPERVGPTRLLVMKDDEGGARRMRSVDLIRILDLHDTRQPAIRN